MDSLLPQDDSVHDIVGKYFLVLGDGTGSDIYFCDDFDPQQGYEMVSLSDETKRRQVSGVEVQRAFNQIYESLGGGRLLCEAGRLTEDEMQLVRQHVSTREGIPSVGLA